MALSAGRLKYRVRLERLLPAGKDGFGHPSPETWGEIATVSAAREDLSDLERVRSAELSAEISCRFAIRDTAQVRDVNPKDRLVDLETGEVHAIVGRKRPKTGGKRWIELSTFARADGGGA